MSGLAPILTDALVFWFLWFLHMFFCVYVGPFWFLWFLWFLYEHTANSVREGGFSYLNYYYYFFYY